MNNRSIVALVIIGILSFLGGCRRESDLDLLAMTRTEISQEEKARRGQRFFHDNDSNTPLCANQSESRCKHSANIVQVIRRQQLVLREGLDNYSKGDPMKLMLVARYLAAFARKLERDGRGYAAAQNAFCALRWQQRAADRGCDAASAACYCYLGFGGALDQNERSGSTHLKRYRTGFSIGEVVGERKL